MTDSIMTQDEPQGDAAALPVRPASIPEKFWDATAGVVRLDALLKSYQELERRLAQGMPDASTEDGRAQLLKLLGRPDTPDEYQIVLPEPYLQNDPELNARLHQLGFTGEQVNAVYTLAAERLVPMILDIAAGLQAERDLSGLVDHFGGPEKWAEMARQLLSYGRKNLAPDVLRTLAASADGIKILHRMMTGAVEAGPGQIGVPVAVDGLDAVNKLMRDPKYWRDHDPATIAKVTAGFERLYQQ